MLVDPSVSQNSPVPGAQLPCQLTLASCHSCFPEICIFGGACVPYWLVLFSQWIISPFFVFGGIFELLLNLLLILPCITTAKARRGEWPWQQHATGRWPSWPLNLASEGHFLINCGSLHFLAPALCPLSPSAWASLLRRRKSRPRPRSSEWTQPDQQGLHAGSRFLSWVQAPPGRNEDQDGSPENLAGQKFPVESRRCRIFLKTPSPVLFQVGGGVGTPRPPSALEPEPEATEGYRSQLWEEGASHEFPSFSSISIQTKQHL